jgi:iron(III) transport system substrate-binding protein
MHRFLIISVLLLCSGFLFAAGSKEQQEVNIYSHRHYDTDQALYHAFEEETGIKVNIVTANADELIQRLKSEGDLSPADILITADAGRLGYAKEIGLLQSFSSEIIEDNVPAAYRDFAGYWTGLTLRGRVVVFDTAITDGSELSTYEALAEPVFKDQILIRSSSNIYNQSLLASLIAHNGAEAAYKWAEALVGNMARDPKGNDRDQMKSLIAGEGRYAIVNTYYIGLLLNSTNSNEREVGERIGVFFPNQNGRGAHVNISGAGITTYAPNRDNAISLLEFLTSEASQALFAQANYEYPVREGISLNPTVAKWGEFKKDTLSLSKLGELNTEAVKIFDQSGWK